MSAAYETFRDLHKSCFVMPNPWDGASSVLLAREGFPALASTSLGIAFAMGVPDGRAALSREVSIENAAMIHRLTGLPVNGDLEDGFGPSPEDCVLTVEASIKAGLAGLGIEDTTANPADPIHGFDQAVARVKAAAKAAKGRILLTGRTDNFLNGRRDLDDTIRRLQAFAEVGADVLYAPGLPDMAAIEAVVKAVAPKPVNVVFGPGTGPVPLSVLAAAGVKRVSLGGVLYRHAMGSMVLAAKRLREGDFDIMKGMPTSAEITKLLPQLG
ncbi:isocitrate lyase/PEP mutase family protein [Roseococcus sp. YIM B11640]|uniref:isocitrate lyase/PEP mutase family protein n=1 Tax=Roseococcus sp. YIM B11640 TaxID=3133973 RepID=UPI003C79C9E2